MTGSHWLIGNDQQALGAGYWKIYCEKCGMSYLAFCSLQLKLDGTPLSSSELSVSLSLNN